MFSSIQLLVAPYATFSAGSDVYTAFAACTLMGDCVVLEPHRALPLVVFQSWPPLL